MGFYVTCGICHQTTKYRPECTCAQEETQRNVNRMIGARVIHSFMVECTPYRYLIQSFREDRGRFNVRICVDDGPDEYTCYRKVVEVSREEYDKYVAQAAAVYLICGSQGTGKDTLAAQIMKLCLTFTWNWKILSPLGAKNPFTLLDHCQRVSFAQQVRDECYIDNDIDDELRWKVEEHKNEPLPELQGRSWREILVEHAQARRAQDPDHWVNMALPKLKQNLYNLVTDFRFLNEYQVVCNNFSAVTTIRVFRQAVPIPQPVKEGEEDPEHSLDDFMTDYVLIPEANFEAEREALLTVFPQYQNYVIIE